MLKKSSIERFVDDIFDLEVMVDPDNNLYPKYPYKKEEIRHITQGAFGLKHTFNDYYVLNIPGFISKSIRMNSLDKFVNNLEKAEEEFKKQKIYRIKEVYPVLIKKECPPRRLPLSILIMPLYLEAN